MKHSQPFRFSYVPDRYELRIRQRLSLNYFATDLVNDRVARRNIRREMRMISHKGYF